MKTKISLASLFMVVAFIISSCESASENTITGFWTATSIHVNSADVMNTAPWFTNVKQDIKTDHSFIAYSDFDTATGNWQSTSTQLTIQMPTDTFVYDYTLVDANHLNMSTTIMGNFSEYSFSK